MSSEDVEPTSESEKCTHESYKSRLKYRKAVSSDSYLLSEPENQIQVSRLRSRSSGSDFHNLGSILDDANFEKLAPRRLSEDHISKLMTKWRDAARRVRSVNYDPWSHLSIDEFPCRPAKRYRYSAIRKTWTEDNVEVKLHPEPFARGAMRECFRLKKLPTFGTQDWKHAQNYVAKKYMNEVDRRVIFEDVKLQMDAKLWAEEFNRYRPPKKIDIMQMCIIEMLDDGQFYHLEHFIEGDYIKYNSNSGFVSQDQRLTPQVGTAEQVMRKPFQAFSHFTFERSGHQMIVVDIQGVGDLYTDPQIHTALGTDYGDGNLGTRGMALFFRSHDCNDICHSLCLSPFDLAPSELKEHEARIHSSPVAVTAPTVFVNESTPTACVPIPEVDDAMEFLRRRTLSLMSADSGHTAEEDHGDDCVCLECVRSCDTGDSETVEERHISFADAKLARARMRSRNSSFASSFSYGSSRMTRNTEREEYWREARNRSMPSCVNGAIELCDALDESGAEEEESRNYQTLILGQIHVDVARYYELGRFEDPTVQNQNRAKWSSSNSELSSTTPAEEHIYDKKAACFHLSVAVKCGNLESITTTAQIAYGIPHDLLKTAKFEDLHFDGSSENLSKDRELFGFQLMERAAEQGDRSAMIFVANALESGHNMGSGTSPNYKKAVGIYQTLLGFQDEQTDRYQMLAKIADLYKEGGYGLEQDFTSAFNYYTEAAEAALEAANGKLANKYFEYAEQCAM